MEVAASLGIGYILGCISPAALICKIKKQDMRTEGTGNLGATNTMFAFGRWLGILVMILDILKAFVAVRLAQLFFPLLSFVGALSGTAAVFGHVFPFYLRFKGGKGYAAIAGVTLGLSPILFLILLAVGMLIMVVTNHGVLMPICTSALMPILYGFYSRDGVSALIVAAASVLVIIMNLPGLRLALSGNAPKARDVLANRFFRDRTKK